MASLPDFTAPATGAGRDTRRAGFAPARRDKQDEYERFKFCLAESSFNCATGKSLGEDFVILLPQAL